MTTDKDFILYLHIPKTGGRTFSHVLASVFGTRYGEDYGLMPHLKYSAGQFRNLLSFHPNLKYWCGHKVSLRDIPWDSPDRRITVIAHVREPVDRFLAHFYFHTGITDHHWQPDAQRLDLKEYVKFRFYQAGSPGYTNGQARTLCGAAMNLNVVEKRIQSGKLILIPTNRYAEGLKVLHQRFPHIFPEVVPKVERVNKSERPPLSEEDPDVLETIARFNTVDKALFELADRLLTPIIGTDPNAKERVL